jgi:hypothetical protein
MSITPPTRGGASSRQDCEAGGNNSYLYNSIGTEQACTYAISNNSKLLSKNQEASKSLALR